MSFRTLSFLVAQALWDSEPGPGLPPAYQRYWSRVSVMSVQGLARTAADLEAAIKIHFGQDESQWPAPWLWTVPGNVSWAISLIGLAAAGGWDAGLAMSLPIEFAALALNMCVVCAAGSCN